MKYCSKCRLSKEPEKFHVSHNEKDGLQPWCIDCRKEHARRNPGPRRAAVKRWQKRNPEIVKKKRRERTLAVYGLSPDEFLTLLARQNFKCKICQESIGSRAHIDHDHETNRIRGCLCTQCNVGLGMFKESKDLLAKAITYIAANET